MHLFMMPKKKLYSHLWMQRLQGYAVVVEEWWHLYVSCSRHKATPKLQVQMCWQSCKHGRCNMRFNPGWSHQVLVAWTDSIGTGMARTIWRYKWWNVESARVSLIPTSYDSYNELLTWMIHTWWMRMTSRRLMLIHKVGSLWPEVVLALEETSWAVAPLQHIS